MLDLTRTQPAPANTAGTQLTQPAVRDTDLQAYKPEPSRTVQGFFAGVGLAVILVLVLLGWEKFAPEDWRPTTLLGNAVGAVVTSEKIASMEASAKEARLLEQEKARHEIEVKDYETRMAMMAKGYEAQIEMQRAAFEGQVQRTTEAYKALYARGTEVANLTAQLVSSLIQQRAALAQGHQGGKVIASVVGDLMSLWGRASGNDDLVTNGRQISTEATNSSLQAFEQAVGRPLPDFRAELWAANLPDHAQLMAEIERMKPPVQAATPRPPQRDAPPPAPYARLNKE